MEEVVGAADVADPDAGDVAEAPGLRMGGHEPVEIPCLAWEKERTQAPPPHAAPFPGRYGGRLARRPGGRFQPLKYGEQQRVRSPAEAFGVEEPAVLRQGGKQLRAHGHQLHLGEMVDQVLQQGGGVRGMPDLGGHDEGHSTARLQQARRSHEKGRPGRGQSGELGPQRTAKAKGPLPGRSLEILVPDEWRFAGGAIEALLGLGCPGEEIPLVNKRPGRTLHGHGGGGAILLDADAVAVTSDEPAIAAGRIEHPFGRRANCSL